MADLGDLLELLHTAHLRDMSVRATILHWSDEGLSQEVLEKWSAMQGGSHQILRMRASEEVDRSHETREVFNLWHRAPGNLWRVEWMAQTTENVNIVNGAKWWSNSFNDRYWTNVSPDGTPAANVGGGLPRPVLQTIFEPQLIPALSTLEVSGETQILGRAALLALGRLSADGKSVRHLFALGAPYADTLKLLVDRETGILMRVELWFEGKPFDIWEMQSIGFNEAIEDALFEGPSDAHFPLPAEAFGGNGMIGRFIGRVKLAWLVLGAMWKSVR
jgi:hypothetical protein